MWDKGVIEPTNSEWAAPVVLAPKPDGKMRFCIDYRRLNAVTKKDTYPLPRLEDCIDSLGNAKWFSTLDCNCGFWQIKLNEEDREKTAFTSHAGTFQWNSMPFGLCNAPATFQRTLDILLSGYNWRSCLVYVDDVVIFSSTFDDHVRHVREVLTALRAGGLSLKLKKCTFFSPTVDYLGHVIRPGPLEVAEKNTAALKQAQYPRTQTELRSFLGMCNVYRRFVPNFARVSAPLNRHTSKNAPKELPSPTPEEVKAFKTLKDALTSPPVLRLPDPSKPYSVDTDACNTQLGCALFQADDEGVRHPIGFWSRSLTPAEKNYTASERECLAVIWAVQILRPYLEFKHFTLFTDHAALKWVMNLTDVSNSRLARWRMQLLSFDITIKYRKGAENTIADAISRLPTFGHTKIDPDLDIPCLLVGESLAPAPSRVRFSNRVDPSPWDAIDWDPVEEEPRNPAFAIDSDFSSIAFAIDAEVSTVTLDEVRHAQEDDDDCIAVRAGWEACEASPYVEDERGLICRRSPIDGALGVYVPQSLHPRVLYLAHHTPVAGHPGITRQYYTMRQQWYWQSMVADIRKVSINCHVCAQERVKLRAHQRPLKLFPAKYPLESVAIDILGPLHRATTGHLYLLVITDRFSKLIRVVPLKSITAFQVAKAFVTHCIVCYGAPASLLSDNGSQFTSKLFLHICSELKVRNAFTTTYHPQTNGQAERFNRTILAGLRAFVSEHPRSWPQYAELLTYAYNTQAHPSLGVSPFELVLSNPPPSLTMKRDESHENAPEARKQVEQFQAAVRKLAQTATKRLHSAQHKYKRNYDEKVRPLHQPSTGDWIYIARELATEEGDGIKRRHKLQSRATGPFKILDHDDHGVTIEYGDGTVEKINRDRVVRAPGPPTETNPVTVDNSTAERAELGNESSAVRTTAIDTEPERYVVDKILDYDAKEDRFLVKWLNYPGEDTYEPPGHLPYNLMARFFRKRGQRVPRVLHQYKRNR